MQPSRHRNDDCAWHEFDPESYLAHNYATVHIEDRRTLEFVRDFFAETFATKSVQIGLRGIDVGTGANLYPALAMLPFCDRVTLYEYSQANIDWLIRQRAADWPSWNSVWASFWLVLCEHRTYAEFAELPSVALARRADITLGSIFELDATTERWDVGTMFFVAESITGLRGEFAAAVNHFLGVLRPGAPFAIAFMAHSSGYQVAGRQFPAVAVSPDEVRRHLDDRAINLLVEHIHADDDPLRKGYHGIIVACGRVKDGAESGSPEQFDHSVAHPTDARELC